MTNGIIIGVSGWFAACILCNGVNLRREWDGSGSIDTLAWRCDVLMHVR